MSAGVPDQSRRILVIDDNHAIHEDFRRILAVTEEENRYDEMSKDLFGDGAARLPMPRFEVDSAFQGAEGLDRVKDALATRRPYALAFVDVRMPPGWDGVETTARLWEAYADLQVVICTAYSDYCWEDMLRQLGQSDRLVILKKPFDNVEVLQLASALSEKWRLLQQTRLRMEDLEHQRDLIEVELRQAQKLEAIGRLAAGIAHEINTPTQYIGDNTRFAQDAFGDLGRLVAQYEKLLAASQQGAVTPELLATVEQARQSADLPYLLTEVPKALEQSLEGVGRVTRIVRAMKEFSHPGTGQKTLLDLNHAIESTLAVARNEWKYVAELATEFDPTLPPVPCLPGEFNQVILNLIINGAHAIAEVAGGSGKGKGRISVRTQRVEEWAEIRIGDSGSGIPEEIRGRIFEPFFTTKGVGKGTGQGLAIARSVVVDKHGGTISFETETGKGTTFIIRLPLKEKMSGAGGAGS
jgi:signal transduction histidine kinase